MFAISLGIGTAVLGPPISLWMRVTVLETRLETVHSQLRSHAALGWHVEAGKDIVQIQTRIEFLILKLERMERLLIDGVMVPQESKTP